MPIGKLVFAQLMDFLPLHTFRRCVARYPSNYPTKTFSHLDQYLSMAFAQLTFRESLRDIEVCLRAHEAKLYHLGIRGHVARSNLGDANEKRDWRIYRDFANSLIAQARRLYADDAFAVDLDNTVYTLDTTTIDLSLKVFPWAHFRKAKAAVKMHTQIDLRGNIPSFIHVSDGKMHEVNGLDLMTPEPGSFSIMDRGFLDFARLYRLTQAGAFFVIRPKSNTAFQRVYSRSVDKTTGLRCDQTVRLTGVTSANDHPQYLRYVVFCDEENDKRLGFFTNNFELPALTIAQLYKCRWQVELFFKWINQHLRIKAFFGTNENAVKTQIWIAISVYVLVAIVKKRLGVAASLYARGEGKRHREGGLHTLYISPLKALAVDIARNLERPVADMALPIRIETRTGDTPASKRSRQRRYPPDILLTTPEQLALLLASADAPFLFGRLQRVVLDELHALVTSKRGDLLALGLARLFQIAPQLATIGLSATVAEPDELRRYLVPQPPGGQAHAKLIIAEAGAAPVVVMLDTAEHLPWAGHSARHALGEIYALIKRHRTTLVFVNTRSQAEMLFQELWRINDDALAIALHHGSLDVAQRRKVEAAMVQGRLRAVVCTSSLDLGIDWGDVDLVVNVGAPKGASRLTQRIGRANHRLDEPSQAVLVPANRFEVLECRAAIDAIAENAQDTPPLRTGALDVLAQHVLGTACGAPFRPDDLYAEVRSAAPYGGLSREDFDAVVDYVATGGYALKAYERFAKIRPGKDGRWRITHPRIAQRYRLNVGTIVEEAMIKIRLVRSSASRSNGPSPAALIGRGGRVLGEVEEYFIETLAPGDTFVFAGEVLRYETLTEDAAYVSRAAAEDPKVPAYAGGKFPLSTYLAERVRKLLAEPKAWGKLPNQVHEWLDLQRARSRLPKAGEMLVETFPRADKHYLVCYPFEGRLAHQTLGMLLTRRLERAGLKPLGFVADEYALAVWGLRDLSQAIGRGALSLAALFEEDMLGDDLEAWLAESALMKRTFRQCAIVAGLIERRTGREEKTRRQMTVSTDLLYDVLRRHQPDHVLLRAARAEAATGLLDIRRLGLLLLRVQGRIIHAPLDRVSPLAVPVMLEVGRESIEGEASDALLAEAQAQLVREAME